MSESASAIAETTSSESLGDFFPSTNDIPSWESGGGKGGRIELIRLERNVAVLSSWRALPLC